MARAKPSRPSDESDDFSPEETASLRAELAARLDHIREAINRKRRRAGMVEIEDGVWIRPNAPDGPS